VATLSVLPHHCIAQIRRLAIIQESINGIAERDLGFAIRFPLANELLCGFPIPYIERLPDHLAAQLALYLSYTIEPKCGATFRY
jgi:hypothetical protein